MSLDLCPLQFRVKEMFERGAAFLPLVLMLGVAVDRARHDEEGMRVWNVCRKNTRQTCLETVRNLQRQLETRLRMSARIQVNENNGRRPANQWSLRSILPLPLTQINRAALTGLA